MGQMVKENIILLTKFKNASPKYLFYKWQAVSLVKSCLWTGKLLQFHYDIFFKMTFKLPNWIDKIKMD